MTIRPLLIATAALLASTRAALSADQVVSNITAAKRPGPKLVDIS